MCRKISYHNTKFFVVTIFWLIGRKLNKPRHGVEKGAFGLHLKDSPNRRKKGGAQAPISEISSAKKRALLRSFDFFKLFSSLLNFLNEIRLFCKTGPRRRGGALRKC